MLSLFWFYLPVAVGSAFAHTGIPVHPKTIKYSSSIRIKCGIGLQQLQLVRCFLYLLYGPNHGHSLIYLSFLLTVILFIFYLSFLCFLAAVPFIANIAIAVIPILPLYWLHCPQKIICISALIAKYIISGTDATDFVWFLCHTYSLCSNAEHRPLHLLKLWQARIFMQRFRLFWDSVHCYCTLHYWDFYVSKGSHVLMVLCLLSA